MRFTGCIPMGVWVDTRHCSFVLLVLLQDVLD